MGLVLQNGFFKTKTLSLRYVNDFCSANFLLQQDMVEDKDMQQNLKIETLPKPTNDYNASSKH